MQGNERAEYGTELIKKLSKELTQNYGKGFDYSSLYKFVTSEESVGMDMAGIAGDEDYK